ncbi:hypothetical protein CAP35_08235 [Chitinophagaceae bacterium IBVUCB1]|nr:hypothetical protein CAP35_08235 [Chitinophagaceae bacterium IBVUCB1]
MNHLIRLALFVFICLSACKKKDSNKPDANTVGVPYKIFNNGSKAFNLSDFLVNETISFYSTIPTSKKIKWIFDDGATSTEASPKHSYTKARLYTVSIIVDDDSLNKNGLNPTLDFYIYNPYNAKDFSKINTSRLWEVVVDTLNRSNYQKQVTNVFTENFAVTLLNDSTLIFKADTLTAINKGKPLFYEYAFAKKSTYYANYTLIYYFQQDSMVYTHHPDQGGESSKGMVSHRYGTTTSYYSRK